MRKPKRIFWIPVFLMLAVFVALAIGIGWVTWMETHLPAIGEYDVIIVLGAQVRPDGTPSIALERRLTAALEEYEKTGKTLIVSGAQGKNEPCTEGDRMRQWMIEQGVPQEKVIAETESQNTRDNLVNSQKIMEENGWQTALVVTSDYHVPRALKLCRILGIQAYGKGSPSKPEYFLKNHFRELLSWIKLWWEELT